MGRAQQFHGAGGYQHLCSVILVEPLQTRGEIHRIAVHRVVGALAGADIAGEHVTAVDADASAKGDAGKLVARYRLLNLLRGAYRLIGVLRVGDRYVKGDQHGVTLQLVDNAAMAGDHRDYRFEVGIQHANHVFRAHGFGDARKVGDVGVKNGRHGLHGLDVAVPGNNGIDHAFGDVLAEYAANYLQLLDDFVAQPFLVEARLHPRAQQHRVERLLQVVLGARLDTAHDGIDFVDRRNHDDRNMAQFGIVADLLEYLVAIHLGH